MSLSPRAASPIRAATLRPLQHRGEKVKFFELEPLNARKNGDYAATREANAASAKSRRRLWREKPHSAAARLPQATPNKRHMDMSLVAAAPLGLGVLIALGGILYKPWRAVDE